ncbi:MAG: glycosyltransferase family 4 protein [Steroidobacteraceae bacterium]
MAKSLSFVLPGDLDTRTGGYGYDREIIAGLRELGWEIDVHSLDGSFPFPSAAAIESARTTLAALPENRLVIVDGLAFGAMPELAEAEARRLKLVGLVHHPLALESGLTREQSEAFTTAERRALATTRAVIVTSPATSTTLRDYGVPAGHVTVVEPGTTVAPAASGSGSSTLALVCVASITARKGHDLLFDALAELKAFDWRLDCIGGTMGDSRLLGRLRDQLHRHGLLERVTFSGEGDDAMVARGYAAADLFVLPTRYEGYGMVVAEALARGLPVVSTRTGAIAELVGEQAGLIVPPGDMSALRDALRRIFSDAGLRASLREGAIAVRSRLPRWQDSARKLATLLEGVIHA